MIDGLAKIPHASFFVISVYTVIKCFQLVNPESWFKAIVNLE